MCRNRRDHSDSVDIRRCNERAPVHGDIHSRESFLCALKGFLALVADRTTLHPSVVLKFLTILGPQYPYPIIPILIMFFSLDWLEISKTPGKLTGQKSTIISRLPCTSPQPKVCAGEVLCPTRATTHSCTGYRTAPSHRRLFGFCHRPARARLSPVSFPEFASDAKYHSFQAHTGMGGLGPTSDISPFKTFKS